MKIFISIPWFFPAYKAGGPITSLLTMLRVLQDHEIRIFTSNEDVDGEELPEITPNTWYAYNSSTTVFYASSRNRSNKILTAIQTFNPDVIYAVGIFSWHFTCVPIFFSRKRLRILSVRGMLHTAALKQKALKKNLYLSALQFFALRKRAIFHATDSTEEKYIREVFGKKAAVKIAANLPNFFTPVINESKKEGTLSLVSICLISPMKNILVVLQALQGCDSEIDYHIYGAIKDEGYWKDCKKLIKQMPENIKVTYHGAIAPTGVEKILALYDVCIQPSESENYGHSMAEALSAAVPLITSHHTPWQELASNKAGRNTEINEAEIGKAIQEFAAMPEADFAACSAAAAEYIREKVNLEEITNLTKNLFQQA